MDWLHTVAGFGVGLMVGLTGVGGGALMTPVLVLLFGVAPATAVGTDLWFAAMTKLVGAGVHGHGGTVDWQVFRRLCLGSLPASIATLGVMKLGGVGQSGDLIVIAVGVVLLFTALAMLFKSRMHRLAYGLRTQSPAHFKRMQAPLTVVAGMVLGVLVTLTSIGAGALGAVMLIYLYPLRMTPVRLVGTDIVHAVPLTLLAGSGHLVMGNVDGGLLGWLLMGSVPGILVGSLLSARVPERTLRVGIAAMLALVGMKMVAS